MKKRQNELSQKLYKDINPFSFFSSAVFFNLLSIESFLVPSTKLCTELGGIAILDTKKKDRRKKEKDTSNEVRTLGSYEQNKSVPKAAEVILTHSE